MLIDLVFFRSKSGAWAVSMDDGETIVTPVGRKVVCDEAVWTEDSMFAEEMPALLSTAQQDAIQADLHTECGRIDRLNAANQASATARMDKARAEAEEAARVKLRRERYRTWADSPAGKAEIAREAREVKRITNMLMNVSLAGGRS